MSEAGLTSSGTIKGAMTVQGPFVNQQDEIGFCLATGGGGGGAGKPSQAGQPKIQRCPTPWGGGEVLDPTDPPIQTPNRWCNAQDTSIAQDLKGDKGYPGPPL